MRPCGYKPLWRIFICSLFNGSLPGYPVFQPRLKPRDLLEYKTRELTTGPRCSVWFWRNTMPPSPHFFLSPFSFPYLLPSSLPIHYLIPFSLLLLNPFFFSFPSFLQFLCLPSSSLTFPYFVVALFHFLSSLLSPFSVFTSLVNTFSSLHILYLLLC